jgi:glycosyltransferase involved in cell wall biosynthesis
MKSAASDEVDVVIPVHNGARYLRECVGSVLSQTLKPRRVIVVDDGSTDETADVIRSLQDGDSAVLMHGMGGNFGVAAARNAGIKRSDAPFIAFIDADDIWMPNKLALQMEVFKTAPRPLGFVHSSYFLVDEAGHALAPLSEGAPRLLSGNAFSTLLREGNILSGSASSVLIRRDVLDAAGLFDDQLYYGEDLDLWLRLAAISEVGHVSEAVVGIRIHAHSAQTSRVNKIDRFLQMIRVYSRWEAPVRRERGMLRKLRRDGFSAVISGARSPGQAISLYRTLKASSQELARNLYGSELDFWSGLLLMAIERACLKVARLPMQKSIGAYAGLGRPRTMR